MHTDTETINWPLVQGAFSNSTRPGGLFDANVRKNKTFDISDYFPSVVFDMLPHPNWKVFCNPVISHVRHQRVQ